MKKYIYILVMSLAVTLLSSCEDNSDIFDKSPDERIQEAVTAFEKKLLSAEYGWEMRYFSTANSAGYPLLVKFHPDSRVDVAGQNRFTGNAYNVATSYYDVINGNGALLTFETYNEVLHAFSNPVDPNGKGQEGDYEFYNDPTYNDSADVVMLIGKKRGLHIRMTKITNSEYYDWVKLEKEKGRYKQSAYFRDVEKINKVTFANNEGAAFVLRVAGGGPYLLYDEYQFLAESGEVVRGFVLTPSGLHLYEGYERSGVLAVNFQLDNIDNPNKFVCTDVVDEQLVKATIEPRYTPLQVYQNSSKTAIAWVIDNATMGTTCAAALDALNNALKMTGSKISEIDLVYPANVQGTNKNVQTNAIRFRYRIENGLELEALIYYDLKFTDKTVTFTYNGANENGFGFMERAGNGDVETGKALVNAIFAKTYSVECASGGSLNSSYLKFIADGNDYFIIHKRKF